MRILINILFLVCLGGVVFYIFNKERTPINEEYLIGKTFGNGFLMGAKSFYFINTKEVKYSVNDKRRFGYTATYTLKNENDKQYIVITNIEKFGAEYMLNYITKKEKILEVINPKKLRLMLNLKSQIK